MSLRDWKTLIAWMLASFIINMAIQEIAIGKPLHFAAWIILIVLGMINIVLWFAYIWRKDRII